MVLDEFEEATFEFGHRTLVTVETFLHDCPQPSRPGAAPLREVVEHHSEFGNRHPPSCERGVDAARKTARPYQGTLIEQGPRHGGSRDSIDDHPVGFREPESFGDARKRERMRPACNDGASGEQPESANAVQTEGGTARSDRIATG